MNSGDCDCGTCCNACGHRDDCLTAILTTDQQDDGYDHDAYTLR